MERLRRLVKKLISDSDSKGILDSVVDLAVESTGAERGLLVRKEGRKLNVVSARNVDRETLHGKAARPSLTIVRESIGQGQTVLIADALREEAIASSESVGELGVRSVLCVPVWLCGEVVAALYVDSRFIPDAFGQDDARFLETLADFAALFFWKIRRDADEKTIKGRLEQLTEEVTELRRQLEEATTMFKSQDRLATARQSGRRLNFPPIIGESPAMNAVYSVIEKVLDNDVTVLISGESGTGKELIARAIHTYGRRKEGPFVAINCSSIPATLIESELFGHAKGAFTGAIRDKKGRFEVADGGTLFLDEIGDMPIEMQGKLLRTLQYGEIQPLGSVSTRTVDVRTIAATNRNLEELVAQGKFREDLYYRLNIVTIVAPPLRQRKEDIPLLVRHFMEENRKQGFSKATGITPRALSVLRKYSWPGNVRELETVIKSACLFADKEILDVEDFEGLIRSDSLHLKPTDPSFLDGRTLEEIEKDVILAALNKNRGNKKRTAFELGIDRRTLYNKLQKWGIR